LFVKGGNSSFNAAALVQQTIVVGKGSQSLSFSTSFPAGAVVAGTPYVPAVSSSAGLGVVVSIDPVSMSVCALNSGVVSFLAAGTCTIWAQNSGNVNFLAAPQIAQSFQVGTGVQTISFVSAAPTGALVDGTTYTPLATSSVSLSVAIIVDPSAAAICAISGGVVRFIGSGSCLLLASSGGNLNYNSAAQRQNFFVAKGIQSLSFTTTPPVSVAVGGASFAPGVISSKGLAPIVFVSNTPTVCFVVDGLVSFTSVGSCVVSATQAGNANYLSSQSTQTVVVTQGLAVISFLSTPPSTAQQASSP
jgi:hypothetical protein